MILLVAAAAAAAAAADIADEPFPVKMCHTNGFPAATCAAVKDDCAQNGVSEGICHPDGTHPIYTNVTIAAIVTSTNNIIGCLNSQSSLEGANKETTLGVFYNFLFSQYVSPSFPVPKPFETSTNSLPGTSCKAPCTTAECDRFCDGAGCAAGLHGHGFGRAFAYEEKFGLRARRLAKRPGGWRYTSNPTA